MVDNRNKKNPSAPEKDRDLRLKNALRANLKLRKAGANTETGSAAQGLRRERPLRAKDGGDKD